MENTSMLGSCAGDGNPYPEPIDPPAAPSEEPPIEAPPEAPPATPYDDGGRPIASEPEGSDPVPLIGDDIVA
jgi:hypothetical protein